MICDKCRKLKTENYPIVFKNPGLQMIAILYQNKVEHYKLSNSETKSEMDTHRKGQDIDTPWIPEGEIEMLTGNGFKKVNGVFEKTLMQL